MIDSASIIAEREALLRYVIAARRAISELRPTDIRTRRLPSAMNEIGMIVETTESAANQIMGAIEDVMGLAADTPLDVYRSAVEMKCLSIMEACAFQDLTGQRISKVVDMLLMLEDKLAAVADVLGDGAEPEPEPFELQGEDDILLNGPAAFGEGVDQEEIDRLFAE